MSNVKNEVQHETKTATSKSRYQFTTLILKANIELLTIK